MLCHICSYQLFTEIYIYAWEGIGNQTHLTPLYCHQKQEIKVEFVKNYWFGSSKVIVEQRISLLRPQTQFVFK